jgi:subtilisin family serine protease
VFIQESLRHMFSRWGFGPLKHSKTDFYKIVKDFGLTREWITPTRQAFLHGQGVRIGIIDSGVPQHHLFTPMVVDSKSFLAGTDVTDKLGHAEMVMGRIAAFAPRAEYYIAKVTDSSPVVRERSVLAAMYWMAANNVHIVNLSLGFHVWEDGPQAGHLRNCRGTCILCSELISLSNRGMVVVAAAGNAGPNAATIACPAIASGDNIISVGATMRTTRALLNSSSRDILGTLRPDVVAPGEFDYKSYIRSGTSFATPVVTGLLASGLVRYSASEAISALKRSCDSIGCAPHEQGHGLVNSEKFMEVLQNVQLSDEGEQKRRSHGAD